LDLPDTPFGGQSDGEVVAKGVGAQLAGVAPGHDCAATAERVPEVAGESTALELNPTIDTECEPLG
jgi:hypothetical protein